MKYMIYINDLPWSDPIRPPYAQVIISNSPGTTLNSGRNRLIWKHLRRATFSDLHIFKLMYQ